MDNINRPLYADLRSESRPEKRRRKHLKRYNNFRSLTPADLPTHLNQQAHYLPSCALSSCPFYKSTYGTCNHWFTTFFPANLSNLTISKFTPHEAYIEAQRSIPGHSHRSHKRRSNHNKGTWTRSNGKQADAQHQVQELDGFLRSWDYEWDLSWIIEIADWEWEGGDWSEWCMHYGAMWEKLRSWESYTEIGETFSKWGQRRINEIRQVKEERLRAELGAAGCDGEERDLSPNGGTGRVKLATTLPITTSDIEAHARLKEVLEHSWRRKWEKFPIVRNCHWFNEYEWHWHRNMTGCFELTSLAAHSDSYWFKCYCELYAPCGRWDPEDSAQPFALEEFFDSTFEGEGMAGDEWEESEELCEEAEHIREEVMDMQSVVEDAHRKLKTAHKDIYDEGLGNDDEIKEVYSRMSEVYESMQALQKGLLGVYEGYSAMCEIDLVNMSLKKKIQESIEEREKNEWEIISLPIRLGRVSSHSSWSMVECGEEL